MKLKYIFFPAVALVFSSALMTACTDTDTAPEGDVVTSDQIEDLVSKDPSVLANTAAGMVTSIANEYNVFTSSTRADDCGYPSVCLSEGTNSGDVVSPASGYNWFSVACSFKDRTYTYANPYIRWSIYYNQIMAVNDLIAKIDPETENDVLKGYLGIAKATRAFDYLQLVQNYAFNYVGHADDPCVPIYLSTIEGDVYDTSRQTVATVYQVVLADLEAAETLLQDYTRPSKDYINLAVVYGLRARYHLVRQEWAEAATYAQKCIDEAAKEGLAPASIADVSKVGNMFHSLSENNWIWGMAFTKSMIQTDGEYETWIAQISSLAAYSYTTEVACYRAINSALWNTISNTDVRKGWWVDENLESPLIEGKTWAYGGDAEKEAPLGQSTGDIQEFLPYTNVKFGVANGELATTNTSSDFPMMRVEEMYLILAEAKGRLNESEGISVLENFVKTYRDPSYVYANTHTATFVDEVWRQRRIELWCEGFAMQDIRRLKKPLVRFSTTGVTSNWDDQYKFNLPAEDPYMLMVIPSREIDGNELISDGDNNQYGSTPAPNSNSTLVDGVTNMW